MRETDARPVYETGKGRLCSDCGRPRTDCACGSGPGEQPVPGRLHCVLRIEKKGRAGKTVTVVDGLPRNRSFVRSLAAELRRACGTGGSAREASVEIQGDQRERVRVWLASKGHSVRG